MKPKLRLASLSLLLCLTSASAQDAISTWQAIVLDTPFHAGDSELREMARVKPQARAFTGAFELPKAITPGVAAILYVNLDVAGVLHMDAAALARARKQPNLGTRLLINGQEAAFLNEFAKQGGANFKYQKMTVRIQGTLLRAGRNEIKVVPGRRSQTDDIEIRRLIVSSRAE